MSIFNTNIAIPLFLPRKALTIVYRVCVCERERERERKGNEKLKFCALYANSEDSWACNREFFAHLYDI